MNDKQLKALAVTKAPHEFAAIADVMHKVGERLLDKAERRLDRARFVRLAALVLDPAHKIRLIEHAEAGETYRWLLGAPRTGAFYTVSLPAASARLTQKLAAALSHRLIANEPPFQEACLTPSEIKMLELLSGKPIAELAAASAAQPGRPRQGGDKPASGMEPKTP